MYFLENEVRYKFNNVEIEQVVNDDPLSLYEPDHLFNGSIHEWGVVVSYSFQGSNDVIPYGRDDCNWKTNYFLGNDSDKWFTKISNFREIIYEELWDGIDLIFKQKDGSIKYDLILHPGSDPDDIRIIVAGADDIKKNREDELLLSTNCGDIIDGGLISFYDDSTNDPIPCAFKKLGGNEFGFELGEYDNERTIVIDPLLYYSTFIGGSHFDPGNGIEIDDEGNAYIVGYCWGGTIDFPVTPGAYDTTHDGERDVYVTKLNHNGSSLLYSTFIGGSNEERGYEIDIDPDGNAYITGYTYSDFPTTSGAFNNTNSGDADVFVTKLDPTGSSLIFSTLLGGSGFDMASGIVIDENRDIYIAGTTKYEGDILFPTVPGSIDTTPDINNDVFVTKINCSGSSLIYSTFLGGSDREHGNGIDIDMDGNAYIAGTAYGPNYPTTSGAYDTSYNGMSDGFITKLDPTGSSIVYSTFIGGASGDGFGRISVDSDGSAYVTGSASDNSYPTTSGAYDTSYNGGLCDVCVSKLSSDGSSLLYSTFIGGSEVDSGYGLTIDDDGNAYVTGWTDDGDTVYPTTPGCFDRTINGWRDMFISMLNTEGSSLVYSTLIGGNDRDHGYDIEVVKNRTLYAIGETWDGEKDFPTTSGAFDNTHNGASDLVVVSLPVSDMTFPKFGVDRSTSPGTTGDLFQFLIDVQDNVGINEAYVEYWFKINNITKCEMNISSICRYNITLPSNSTGPLHYNFSGSDFSGNWNHTSNFQADIVDNDKPIFGPDESQVKGSTGNPFKFSINVSDNIGISSVYLEYWYDNNTGKNVSLAGDSTFIQDILISSTSRSLHYIFHVSDLQGNWNKTIQKDLDIFDIESPLFGIDWSDTIATTGDDFTFSIQVIDNIDLDDVFVEYSIGFLSIQNISMTPILDIYSEVLKIPEDARNEMVYSFHACDAEGNWNETPAITIDIHDNDAPVFGFDRSDTEATTGDVFNFEIEISDNLNVSDAFVEFWYGSNNHTNVSLDNNSDSYIKDEIILIHTTLGLHYIFHAVDPSGNWAHTETMIVAVEDNDPPMVTEDRSDTSATTGDPFLFQIELIENVKITGVFVEYWFDNQMHTNASIIPLAPYTHSIEIPGKGASYLQYIFHFVDISDNWACTDEMVLGIIDNDAPTLFNFTSDKTATTGENFVLGIGAEDNSQLSKVFLEYWFGDGDHKNLSLPGSGKYGNSILIPSSSSEDLQYRFQAVDTSENWIQSDIISIEVIDNDLPIFGLDSSDPTAYKGSEFIFRINVTDNVDVENVYVDYWFGDGSQQNTSMSGSRSFSSVISIPNSASGSLHYIFHAVDAEGNWIETDQVDVDVKLDISNYVIGSVIVIILMIVLILSTMFLYRRRRSVYEE